MIAELLVSPQLIPQTSSAPSGHLPLAGEGLYYAETKSRESRMRRLHSCSSSRCLYRNLIRHDCAVPTFAFGFGAPIILFSATGGG